ncbi:hypothetical protein ACQHIV_24500 [Kribbella sp. GL6]|uniref:hypothetical protein n=1 Tax=Kribbella sp. GL6 TaxID=3419765 RepID=UPI003D061261
MVRTVFGMVLPGLGLFIGGRRRLGAVVMSVSSGLVLIGAYLGLARRDEMLALAVSPNQLLFATVVVVALGVGWVWVASGRRVVFRDRRTDDARGADRDGAAGSGRERIPV